MYLIPPIGQSTGVQQNSDSLSILIPAGTKILLTLQRAIDLRTARIGDTVYLSARFPVVVQGSVVLSAGTYIEGRLAKVIPNHRQNRTSLMQGLQMQVQLTTVILKNGTVVPMQASSILPVLFAHTSRSVIPQEAPLEATLRRNVRLPIPFPSPASNSSSEDSTIPVYIPVFGPQSTPSSTRGTRSSTPTPPSTPYIK
jgi:hypothetical protein